MSYTQTSAGSFTAAVTAMSTYIAANSSGAWSVRETTVEGSGTRVTLEKSSTLEVITLKSFVNSSNVSEAASEGNASGIGIRGGLTYNSGGANWLTRQNGGPVSKGHATPWATAHFNAEGDQTVNYTIFINAERVWIVLRVGDIYQHITFGFMEKVGAWTGGFFFGASASGYTKKFEMDDGGQDSSIAMGHSVGSSQLSMEPNRNPNFYVYCTATADSDNWMGSGGSVAGQQAMPHSGLFETYAQFNLMKHTPNLSTKNAFLLQQQWMWYDPAVSKYRHIGNMPSSFIISNYYLTEEQEVVIGGLTYKVFPCIRKTTVYHTTTLANRGSGMSGQSYYNNDVLISSGHYAHAILKEE